MDNEIYYIDSEQLEKLEQIMHALHGMNDAARDHGHKLWLVLSEIKKQDYYV
jgi:hypothetical protein